MAETFGRDAVEAAIRAFHQPSRGEDSLRDLGDAMELLHRPSKPRLVVETEMRPAIEPQDGRQQPPDL